MMRSIYIYIMVLVVLILPACASRASKSAEATNEAPKSEVQKRFPYITVPNHILAEERRGYMTEHFWDRFDFADTLALAQMDSVALTHAYVSWLRNGVDLTKNNGEPMRRLMRRAATSRKMFDYFFALSEMVLHDPNSPFRCDELYIPVLEEVLASPYYDEYERLAPQYDLDMAMKNRVGYKANNFRYTTASGRTSSLYDIKSEFVLIYIHNPGCPMCRDIQAELTASVEVSEMIAAKRLVVLAIYPDRDLTEWRKYKLPEQWISGYDKGCVIESKQLYDLRAIPSMYLLDGNKCVMLKDCTSVADISSVLAYFNR